MKPSGGQYRPDIGDPGPLSRNSGQHVPAGGHPVYFALSGGSQNTGAGSHASRDYHPHHLQATDLPHRSHLPGPGAIGPGHVPMHMPQRRRTSGHRLSLLWDIGVAGERERDRSESSGSSVLSHTYTTIAGSSHIIPQPVLHGRPSMMSSLGGLQASQKNLGSGSQPPSATPPRHSSSSGQLGRPSSSVHPYAAGSGPFTLPGPSSVKSEPGIGFVKEESKSPMHSMTSHYPPQLIHSQSYSAHLSRSSGSAVKNDPPDKGAENMPSKEFLLQSMEKVDKEITMVSGEIKALERKKQQLENAAKKPPQTEKSASPKKVETKHKDLWQVIYAENKRKAEAARGLLDHLCQRYDMPLYNQPSDTKVYKENLKKNEEMRPKLLAYFQRRSQLSNIRERYLCARYDQLMSDWQRKAEKVENNIKRKTKEGKFREFFEKQFPEIRKQREQQDRFTRSGTRGDACRSEADFNEIVDGLSEQEHQEQHMRQLAVVPPMLLDRDQRRLKFINNNGLVMDPLEDYKKRQQLDHWNAQEKQIFKEKYIQHPKNFHVIASFLEKKSVADCVLFYYLTKKSVGYKALVRKNSLKPRKVKSGRGHAQQSSTSSAATQDASKNGQNDKNQGDKETEQKRESPEIIIKEEEVERIDRPPSPRITRSRNKNMNWTDEDISVAKEGFGKHGKDFAAISRLFTNKTEHQIKNFYNNYKKKHNLDQLISDGKKKKPEGSRRTRTQAQTSESSSTTPPIDETPLVDEARPKSADPQVSTSEVPESAKKRKKDSDADKKEEQKTETNKKVEVATSIPTDAESISAAPRVTTSSTSQIRTRRSAGQSAKRATDSPPDDEPAEKKAKKSKTAKELKTDTKENPPEEDKKVQPEEEENKEEEDEKLMKPESTEKEDLPTEEQPPSSVPDEIAAVLSAPPVITEPASSTPSVQVKDPPSTVSVLTTKPQPVQSVVKMTQVSATPETLEVQKPPPVPDPAHEITSVVQKKRDNDGDSSATCSADEEPNMQDVESKVVPRKHADSPYAFEDDSSASIRLESSRPPIPPVSFSPAIKQPLPAKTPPANAGRPASTHPPQPPNVQQDEKRPQSLPPPPGAITPISALTFHPEMVGKPSRADDPRPNSTPTMPQGNHPPSTLMGRLQNPPWISQAVYGAGHVVGKIPDASEFRNVLMQLGSTAGVSNIPTLTTAQPEKVRKPTSEVQHTIDLTVPTSAAAERSAEVETLRAKEAVQKMPHYHPVPQEASSMQKDFAPHKPDSKPREDPQIQRQHEYTATEIAMMRDRSAAIPVQALRAPMTGTPQRKDMPASEPAIKAKENVPIIVKPHHPAGHPPGTVPTIRAPHLTTSSIQTKVVYGTMTSGAPVRQNPLSKPPDSSMPAEVRRPDVITPTHSAHASDPTRYRKSPVLAAHPPSRAYADLIKTVPPPARESIVKSGSSTAISSLDPPVILPEDPYKKGKTLPGSIMTGLPIQRGHDDRKELIAGKWVVVNKPYPHASPVIDHARQQEAERMHGLRYRNKGLPGTGSIIDGTPVVKRKHSEESNSSLSPSANPSPYPAVVVSHPSPTIPGHKLQDRRPPSGPERSAEVLRNPYPFLVGAEKPKEKDVYHRPVHEKLPREPQAISGVTSPAHRQTPTSSLAQHPTVKQEHPGSPHTTDEAMRRSHPQLPIPLLDFQSLPGLAANDLAHFGGLSHIPLTTPGVSQDLLEIWRQYGRASGVSGPPVYPMILGPAGLPAGLPAGYPGFSMPGLNPAVSPVAPGSPQNDDSRETTKNMLSQDFKTAQLMHKLKQPTTTLPVPGVVAQTLPPPGIPPLIVSTPNPYHALATQYHPGGLPMPERFVIHPGLQRSSFSPQFPVQSGRSSTESRSPSQKPPKIGSPDDIRQRHRSSETPRDFSSHPAAKGRHSPASPYVQRGNVSPQRFAAQGPAHPQLSPSHLTGKHYRPYPHSNTPPGHLPHPNRQMAKSPLMHPAPHLPYSGTEAAAVASRRQESRSPYGVKHIRTGSLEGPFQPRFERPRPDSAGPQPRSLPQSPNDPLDKYGPHARQHSQSPKYRPESKPPQTAPNEQKIHHSRDERGPVRRESPRPVIKHPSDRADGRLPQQPVLVGAGGSYQVTPTGAVPRHETRSPYQPQQPKERIEPASMKEQPPTRVETKPPTRPEMQSQMHIVSSNPREDLRKTGQTKMKAATLIDQIIMNYVGSGISGNSQSMLETPVSSQSSPPSHTKQSSDPSNGRTHSDVEPKRETSSAKPSYESGNRMPLTTAQGQLPHQYGVSQIAHPAASTPGPQVAKEKAPTHTPPLGLTFAKHSSNVIDQLYSGHGLQEKKSSPVRTGSPLPAKQTVMVTEPISPPEKRMMASKTETAQLPQAVYPQMHQQPRFPGPPVSDSKPRHEAPPSELPASLGPVMRGITQQPPAIPGAIPTARGSATTGSLEDIIRHALMNPESSNVVSDSQPAGDKRPLSFPTDMMLHHAMMSSARMPIAPNAPSPKPVSENRKGTPTSSQSVSEQYMSALMFKTGPSQNVNPSADRPQQFYSALQRTSHAPSQPSAAQSPAPQESNSQARQTWQRPQYEALSDSDD